MLSSEANRAYLAATLTVAALGLLGYLGQVLSSSEPQVQGHDRSGINVGLVSCIWYWIPFRLWGILSGAMIKDEWQHVCSEETQGCLEKRFWKKNRKIYFWKIYSAMTFTGQYISNAKWAVQTWEIIIHNMWSWNAAWVGFTGVRDKESNVNNGRKSANKDELRGRIMLIILSWLVGKWRYS